MTSDPRARHRDRVHDRRSGTSCPVCGRDYDQAQGVEVHHRDGNERNGQPENLRKRCPRCHYRYEHDRPEDADGMQPPGPRRSGPSRPRTAPR